MPAALDPATALYLQRAAGNRAVARMVAPQRMVARCGPGGCACVGRRRGDELKYDAVLERLRRRSLARSVAARSHLRTLTRCSGGGCTCGGRCHAGGEELFDESEALRMRSLARSAMPIRGPPAKRTLARCSAGGCTCGGRCKDRLDDEEGEAQLRRRMLARKTGVSHRDPSSCDACTPPAEASARPGTFGDADVADYKEISPLGDKAWKLANFDVDRNYVKQEHRDFLIHTIIPEVNRILDDPDTVDTEIAVVGEASTTYTSSHNLKLSECRAQCVMDIIKAQLGTKANLVFRMVWKGKDLALKRGHPDEKENDDDRRVTVIPVHKRAGEKPKCPRDVRVRSSIFLRAKTACGPGGSISVNIGEESDPNQPVFRRFRWWPDSFFDTCRFRALAAEAGTSISQEFSLAKTDPDSDTDLPSWETDAPMDRQTNEISLGGGGFKISPPGTWSSACAGQPGALGGRLLPVGPVECGEVPQPKEWNCDEDKKEKCSVDDRRAAGKKFAAMLVRFSHDLPLDKLKEKIAPYLPGPMKWLLGKLTAGVTVCVVRIGSLDTTPRLTRTFLFTGLEFFGPAGLDEQWGVDKEAAASQPMKLAYDPDDMISASDFDSNIINTKFPFIPEFAKLKIDGNHTATEHLSVGDIEFDFKGIKCHNDDGRTVRGMMQGVSAVSCEDIGPWVKYAPNRECSKDECPEEQRLDDHYEFEFKIGRASLAGMPSIPGGAEGPLDWANALGCDVTAAFINIGSTGENAIHRKGIFIGKKKSDPAKPSTPPCSFSFGSGTAKETFFFPRQLARDHPGEALATSDFHGTAELDDKNALTVHPPLPALNYTLKVPGGFTPPPITPDVPPRWAPCAKLGAEGVFWPIAPVECGKAPMPPHMTAKDPDPLQECRKQLLNLHVLSAIYRLENGDFKNYVDALPTGTGPNGTTRPFLFYFPALTALKTKVNTIVENAIFVGRNEDGTPVVAVVDMQVDAYHDNRGDPIVEVVFRSEPCTFDASGNAVYMQRRRCKEAFWYKGAGRDLRTPGHRPDTLSLVGSGAS